MALLVWFGFGSVYHQIVELFERERSYGEMITAAASVFSFGFFF
jgi:hypothetical protein